MSQPACGKGRKAMIKSIHPVAGSLATFWLATALSELFASEAAVAAVKIAIP
jgi:hypothetical protein